MGKDDKHFSGHSRVVCADHDVRKSVLIHVALCVFETGGDGRRVRKGKRTESKTKREREGKGHGTTAKM